MLREHSFSPAIPYTIGNARGRLIASNVELSVWGGVDPNTGKVIDRHHPLCGSYLKDSILAIPGGRGSCAGSGVMLELVLNGNGPKAILFERQEDIITLGVLIAEEIFQTSIPVLVLKEEDFQNVLQLHGMELFVNEEQISTSYLDFPSEENNKFRELNKIQIYNDIHLSDLDRQYLSGLHGQAASAAMRIICRMAGLMGAQSLMSVTQVHVDGCFYTGPGSLAFAEKLRDLGGKVQVPTTLNSISIDQKRWRSLGVDSSIGDASNKLADAYCDMGARPTFTCAPYQLDSAPKKGSQIAWAESNAVVYANSVLGARTMKYPDFLDIAIALTGRAPLAGPHITHNRYASLWVAVENIPQNLDDSFYPILGYYVGGISVNCIPVITGMEKLSVSKDNLRAFGASFATVSSAPMFHMVSVTPEAPSLEATCPEGKFPRCVVLSWKELVVCWKRFNNVSSAQEVDLISLGNPHFSFSEIKELAKLCSGKTKHDKVDMIITCGRSVHGLATQAGLVNELEKFGVQFLVDTCWCLVTDPIIPRRSSVIMTNSAKYAHYGPGLTGRKFCFGSMKMCVEVACCRLYDGGLPEWLQGMVRRVEHVIA